MNGFFLWTCDPLADDGDPSPNEAFICDFAIANVHSYILVTYLHHRRNFITLSDGLPWIADARKGCELTWAAYIELGQGNGNIGDLTRCTTEGLTIAGQPLLGLIPWISDGFGEGQFRFGARLEF